MAMLSNHRSRDDLVAMVDENAAHRINDLVFGQNRA